MASSGGSASFQNGVFFVLFFFFFFFVLSGGCGYSFFSFFLFARLLFSPPTASYSSGPAGLSFLVDVSGRLFRLFSIPRETPSSCVSCGACPYVLDWS